MEHDIRNYTVENRQFSDQVNLVYISSFFVTVFFLPIFIYIGNLWLISLNFMTVFASIVAYFLNRNNHYGVASLVFISIVSLQSFVEVYYFGIASGFIFYFFNMAVLIVYTNWKNIYRAIGVLIQTGLIFISFLMTQNHVPIIELTPFLFYFFLISNILLNVSGVTNSANFHLNIVRDVQKELSRLAMTDYLTGLPNRAALSLLFDQQIKEAIQQKSALAVMMIDIDYFKSLNDNFGHLCGDYILKRLSDIFIENKPDNAIVSRFGGEEFLYIQSVHSRDEMSLKANLIRNIVEKEIFVYQSNIYQITVSIGALFVLNPEFIEKMKYIDLADKMLYEAKQIGRNLVICKDLA